VLVEKIDDIRPQPLQRGVCNCPDVFRLAIQAYIRFAALEPEFGRDHGLLTERRHSLAEQFLIREWTIGFRGVEECDAALKGGPYECNRLLLFRCRSIPKAQSHAA